MIIILEPQKDTYVTNLKTLKNDGVKANVGHAATIDFFKLHNENKHSHSWAAFNCANIAADDEFVLNYLDGTSLTFIFNNSEIKDGSIDAQNRIIIGISNLNNESKASRFRESLNSINANDTHSLKIDIAAYNNSSNQILLKQKKPGESGDIGFTLPDTITHVGGLDKFARIDYSAALIKFNLEDFKTEFEISNNLNDDGAFQNLTAELVLKDVTTGISKPRNFTLEAYMLKKDFNEGLGKDTVHFSDSSNANFQTFNGTENWEIESFISSDDADAITNSSFEIVKGDEDLVFDITSYIKDELIKSPLVNKGILVKFPNIDLYDKKSYFAKRVGSRHLSNKSLIPELRIYINDSSYHIPVNSFNKQRFLNNNEIFYLFNRASGTLIDFVNPDTEIYDNIKFKITSKDNATDLVTPVVADNNNLTNFKGNSLTGIYKASVNVDKFNVNVNSLLKNNKLEANYVWYWSDNDAESPAADMVILTQRVDFLLSETLDSFNFENLVSVVKIDENFINGDDCITSMKAYFVDTTKEFDAVKIPYELPSENLGDVYYQVHDVDNNKVLVDYHEDATKMFYDGEKYIFDFYVSKKFKNVRINFKFKYKDTITQVDKFIYNKNWSIRVV